MYFTAPRYSIAGTVHDTYAAKPCIRKQDFPGFAVHLPAVAGYANPCLDPNAGQSCKALWVAIQRRQRRRAGVNRMSKRSKQWKRTSITAKFRLCLAASGNDDTVAGK